MYGRKDEREEMMKKEISIEKEEKLIKKIVEKKGRRGMEENVGERGVKI